MIYYQKLTSFYFYHITKAAKRKEKTRVTNPFIIMYLREAFRLPQDREPIPLQRRLRHILNINPISPCRVVHKYMGHGADELAVLNNGRAGHG